MSLSVLVVPLVLIAAPDVSPVLAADTANASAPVPSSEPSAQTVSQVALEAPAPEKSGAPEASASVQGHAPDNEIVVTRRTPSPADPAEHLNAVSYEAVQAVDKAVIGPIAHTYEKTVPTPVRDGLHNALDNLDEPIVFVNFLLQLKPGKALETLGRFAINSTLGLAGLFDVAKRKPFNLPRRSNGLADTLGFYGVGPGPYLFLPVIGSTTLRDLIARPFDLLVLPVIAPKPFADPKVALGKSVLNALDERVQDDGKFLRLRSAPDPYVAQREEYLARRKAEIEVLKGKRKSLDDPPYYQWPDTEPKNRDDAKRKPSETSAAPANGAVSSPPATSP